MNYIAFIGTGMVCQSAMFTASFEGMYSAFSRMHVQRTWEGIINAPIALDDVVFAEWVWAASKAVISTAAILAVIVALGYGHTWLALLDAAARASWSASRFGAAGLVMNALAPELRLLHLLLHAGADADAAPVRRVFSGRADAAVAGGRQRFLPLKHAIDLARPLMLGTHPRRHRAARRRARVLRGARATTSRWC